MTYAATKQRVEHYFDRTATRTWERLTSDAPVSGVRATVRAGRDRMRGVILDALPRDLTGQRVLDAGCGTGALAIEMANRGAEVLAIDISPRLIDIAAKRAGDLTIDWRHGDMFAPDLGTFDHVVAMDSMIYYSAADLGVHLGALMHRVRGSAIFTLPPRTPLLMMMWRAGKLFPQSDRSPVMVPQSRVTLAAALHTDAELIEVERVTSGFYISTAYRLEAHG